MHAISYDMSSLSSIFLPHLNTFNTLECFVTSYVTSLFASCCSIIVYSDLSSSLELNSSSSTELFCGTFLLKMVRFDLPLSVEQLYDKVLCTIMCFCSSSPIEQMCNKVLCTLMHCDLSSSVEQTCKGQSNHFCSYRVNVQVEVGSSYHTLRKLS